MEKESSTYRVKETKERKTTTQESMTRKGIHPCCSAVPLPEALVGVSLPLPGEIVTTDVSLCGNEGA